MQVVSQLLKRLLYPALTKTGRFRRGSDTGPAILTYHGIFPDETFLRDVSSESTLVRRESLRRQLELLKTRYHVISPEQFRQWCRSQGDLSPRSELLTCDDGLHNALTDMVPVLQEAGLSCLFFLTESSLSSETSLLWHDELRLMLRFADSVSLNLPMLGVVEHAAGRQQKQALWWSLVKKLSGYGSAARLKILEQVRIQCGIAADWKAAFFEDRIHQRCFSMLNLEQTRRLVASGMSIGSHTLSHPMLSQLPAELAWKEIAHSRERFERALQQPVWALAYPFGDQESVSQRELGMAERAGYECAFLNVDGGLGAPHSLFAMRRVHVTGDMNLSEFEAHVSGFHRTLRQRFFKEANAVNFVL